MAPRVAITSRVTITAKSTLESANERRNDESFLLSQLVAMALDESREDVFDMTISTSTAEGTLSIIPEAAPVPDANDHD